MNDAYDFWAHRLTRPEMDLIAEFWERFAVVAPKLDKAFRGIDLQINIEREMYRALGPLWNLLFWEFSHGANGTWHLALSADYYHERRAFARATVAKAPTIAGWSFSDSRPPTRDPVAAHDTILTRARVPHLAVEQIECRRGAHRLVELTATGVGSPGQVAGEASVAIAVLLGDAADQDWLGDCIGRARDSGRGGFNLFGSKKPEAVDPAWLGDVRDTALDIIKGFEAERPDLPFYKSRMMDGEKSDFTLQPPEETTDRRNDAIAWTTRYRPLTAARIAGVKITSLRFSRFNESFCGLKIARSESQPFDAGSERAELADRIERRLCPRALGGIIGIGHGLEHIYFDLALADVQRGIGAIRALLSESGIQGPAWLIFDEAGLEDRSVPLTANTPAEPQAAASG